MSSLEFHKCRLCGRIFYAGRKDTYCSKCVPKYESGFLNRKHLSELDMEAKRKLERERWHKRMENPKFREAERLRSLARARAEKKYAKHTEEVANA